MDKEIGFIGLSNMGEPMATNIAKARFDLTVYDIRPESLRALEKLGAKVARSTQEVGERCDIIETIVVSDAQVEEVREKSGQASTARSCQASTGRERHL